MTQVLRPPFLGVYVHLPFCPYICPYCDFAKWPHRRSAADRYLRALEAEIDATAPREAGTIFFGGGTPNAYDAKTLANITQRLRGRFPAPRDLVPEISVEVNPELVENGDFQTYRSAGVTRVSIGVQSFDPVEIATLGRRHSVDQVAAVVASARAAGIGSISIDLMFAVPGQSPGSWRRSLERAIALGVDHVSTYGLTVEEGTPYAGWRLREPGAFLDADREADLYDIAIATLESAGFEHYEISNFARPGHACAHNANYWANGQYVGLGVGAASFLDGVRRVNTRDLEGYLEAAMSGAPIPGEAERLLGTKRAGEAAMLALRTAQGVCLQAFKERYGIDFMTYYAPILANLTADGLLEIDDDRARLTRRGRFLANDACGAFVTFE
ncbi:MAG TPA: radical SAM family heme chaperone HemW [Candidatus Baltobacteraceae bacterium]